MWQAAPDCGRRNKAKDFRDVTGGSGGDVSQTATPSVSVESSRRREDLSCWQIGRIYAHRLIGAADVVNNLTPMGVKFPATERQACDGRREDSFVTKGRESA